MNPVRRLTEYADCAGCAGKISSRGIARLLEGLATAPRHPNVLVGAETLDDAGVYRIGEGLALVQTVDFFAPLVDDPYSFGRIAAANALSDVYAMNGTPITALNIAVFPVDDAPLELLAEVLRGAAERVAAAGAVTLGGHTIRDAGIKFGLSVTGLIDPAEVLTNAGARPGDLLVLTKPLGTGFVTTAAKRGECPDDVLARTVAQMVELNATGRDALRAAGGARGLTDVTGYGLAGHAFEMAQGAGLTLEIVADALPVVEGSQPLAADRRCHTRASRTNREPMEGRLRIEPGTDRIGVEYAFDPQTSGGLLIAVAPDRVGALLRELTARDAPAAAVVGRVTPRQGETALVIM